jgi:hypothetical protein
MRSLLVAVLKATFKFVERYSFASIKSLAPAEELGFEFFNRIPFRRSGGRFLPFNSRSAVLITSEAFSNVPASIFQP